jgi:hypothetical protein
MFFCLFVYCVRAMFLCLFVCFLTDGGFVYVCYVTDSVLIVFVCCVNAGSLCVCVLFCVV